MKTKNRFIACSLAVLASLGGALYAAAPDDFSVNVNAIEIVSGEDSTEEHIYRILNNYCEITLDSDTYYYTGKEIRPKVSAVYNNSKLKDRMELTEGVHYTVEYSDNIEAGTGTVTLKGINSNYFGGMKKKTFNIVKTVPIIDGVKATGTTYNSVKVAWNKNNYVNGYVLYRYDDAKKSWVRLTKISNPNTTSYTVTGLASAKQHQIAVKGYLTIDGKEVGSPKLSIVKATTNPGVVSNFKASGYTTNSVKLTWNKVNGAEGYIVYRYNPSNKGWIRLTKTKGTSYTATGLASGTSYKFAVKSYITLNGKEFGGSQLTQVFTSTNPDKVNFTVKSPSAGRATFNWSKVRGATGYIVYYKANAKDSWHRLTVTSGTSYTKTGLKRGNNYIFTVKAYKTTGGVTYNGAFVNKTLKIR